MNDENKPNIDALIASDDTNGSVIELDNYVCELCEWGERMDKLSAPQKVFYFNQELEREVNNGGFEQYFFNSYGSFAHETIESLNAVNAKKTAELLQHAVNQFPDGKVPKLTEDRRKLMLNLWPESDNKVWEDLDQKFFAYEDDLNALNMAFVQTNHEFF
jgi:hypothetical protein